MWTLTFLNNDLILHVYRWTETRPGLNMVQNIYLQHCLLWPFTCEIYTSENLTENTET